MDKSPPPLSLAAALAMPLPQGRRSSEVFVDGDLEIRFYAPKGYDPQPPHNRDEIYIVAAGHGRFRVGDRVDPISPGALLYVAAHEVHRFDMEHLIFADIRSPGTVSNLRTNPSVEVNVVDHFIRKGYRFKGTARIFESGPDFDRHLEFLGVFDAPGRIRATVTIHVVQARPLISPGYDHVPDEATARAYWLKYYLGETSTV